MDVTTMRHIMGMINAIEKSYEQPDHDVMAGEWEMQAGARFAFDELKSHLQDYIEGVIY